MKVLLSWDAYRQRVRQAVGQLLMTHRTASDALPIESVVTVAQAVHRATDSVATGNPLRILHVIPSVAVCHGGPTQALARMLDALNLAGVCCDVATTDDDGPGRRLSETAQQQQAILPSGRCYFFAKVTEFYKLSPPLFLWLLRRVKDYDVVHIHALFSFSSVAAAWAARWHGVAYVIRPLGTLSHYGVRKRRPWLKRVSMALLEGPLLRRADAVHFTSTSEEQEARAWGVRLRGRVIPLAVVSAVQSASVVAARPAGYVLYLSRIDPKKNLESLLQAFARLQDSHPDLRLVIAGDGDAQYVSALRQMAIGLGVAQRIEWAGFVTGAAKAQLLAHARLFVLPSFSENFGVAAAEALAAGCPCLLTHGVAIAADVQRAGAGLAVDATAISLSRGLAQMLASDDCLQQMGLRAASLAQTAYSVAAMGRALCNLYTTLKARDGLQTDYPSGVDLQ